MIKREFLSSFQSDFRDFTMAFFWSLLHNFHRILEIVKYRDFLYFIS